LFGCPLLMLIQVNAGSASALQSYSLFGNEDDHDDDI
jgi:hypothetical protein